MCFTHGILRDSFYQKIPKKTKQKYHQSIALWIEENLICLEKHYGLLTYHFTKAKNLQKSIFYRVKFANYCFFNNNYETASKQYFLCLKSIRFYNIPIKDHQLKQLTKNLYQSLIYSNKKHKAKIILKRYSNLNSMESLH